MLSLTLLAVLGAGCAVSRREKVAVSELRPAKTSTAGELIAEYNRLAGAVRSLNAAVNLVPVAGSAYSGVIERYHDVNGFILAQKPAEIRVIGQAPVVNKDIFDMVSDGTTFRIFIPSKHKFLVGPNSLERPAQKPIENLRPQHLLDALFWPQIQAGAAVLFEEADVPPARYYILTVLRGSQPLEIDRKLWFDRTDLSLARVQIYSRGGRLLSDIRFADWQPAPEAAASGGPQDVSFPRHIWLERPPDDYRLEVKIKRVTLNEVISADRFRLEQPPGTELVRLGEEDAPEAQP